MKNLLSFHKVQPCDENLINLIADWYLDEWNIPQEKTLGRLLKTTNTDVIIQLVLVKDNKPVATGGLYNSVGLLEVHPKFQEYHPWIALLYTSKGNRNLGYGSILLKELEKCASEIGFKRIYLHTFPAEKLYLKMNWQRIDNARYKGHITVVMKKIL